MKKAQKKPPAHAEYLTLEQKKAVLRHVLSENFYFAFIDGWDETKKSVDNRMFMKLRREFLSSTKRLANFVGFPGFKEAR